MHCECVILLSWYAKSFKVSKWPVVILFNKVERNSRFENTSEVYLHMGNQKETRTDAKQLARLRVD